VSLNIDRLESLLAASGYSKIRRDASTGAIYFSNQVSEAGMYDWCFVTYSGRRDEYVTAWASISLVARSALVKGIAETEAICEIADDNERCLTLIKDDAESASWEERLIKTLPPKLRALRQRHERTMLERSALARANSEQYLNGAPLDIVTSYPTVQESDCKRRAHELAKGPICHLAEYRGLYEIAIYLILSHKAETAIEDSGFDTIRPYATMDKDLLWTVELIVDALMQREILGRRGQIT